MQELLVHQNNNIIMHDMPEENDDVGLNGIALSAASAPPMTMMLHSTCFFCFVFLIKVIIR